METAPTSTTPKNERGLSRRTVIAAAAVAAPVIAVATATPAFATSPNGTVSVAVPATIGIGSIAQAVVTVRTQGGTPWSGQTVTLSVSPTTGVTLAAGGPPSSSVTGITNGSGEFVVDVAASGAGSYTLSADSDGVLGSAGFTVANTTPASITLTMPGIWRQTGIGGSSTASGTLKNNGGQALAGQTVTLSLNDSPTSSAVFAANGGKTIDVTTDANGNFSAAVDVPAVSTLGDFTMRATASNGVTTTYTYSVYGDPYGMTFNIPATLSIGASGQAAGMTFFVADSMSHRFHRQTNANFKVEDVVTGAAPVGVRWDFAATGPATVMRQTGITPTAGLGFTTLYVRPNAVPGTQIRITMTGTTLSTAPGTTWNLPPVVKIVTLTA